jgi:osmotically-inducible protein OsmY
MHEFLHGGPTEFRRTPDSSTPGSARLAHRHDASIHEAIMRALGRAPWLDVKGVSVSVRRGEVRLDGVVAQTRTRAALREIAARCPGVRGINDRLRTDPGTDGIL